MTEASNAQTVVAITEPRPAKVPLVAGNSPRAIVPTDFDGAWRIANAVVTAGMAPRGLDTPEKSTIAILHGLEVGLPPMMALQSIAVINGRPSLWGDGALALIQSSGLLEDMEEHFEGDGENYKAICVLRRKGRSRPIIGEFSVAEAKLSGLWTKRGRNGEPTPWQTYPKRMLKMRARAFACRDGFSDVLKGLAVAEEMEDVVRANQPAPQVVDDGGPPPPANNETGPPAPTEEPTSTEVVQDSGPPMPVGDDGMPEFLRRQQDPLHVPSERQWLAGLEEKLAEAADMETLANAQTEHMTPYQNSVSEQTWQMASDLLDHHIERLQAE